MTGLSLAESVTVKVHPSPGHMTFVIDPEHGDDASAVGKPWKSFRPLLSWRLAAGDEVLIHPGLHPETLKLNGEGSAQEPITIRFLPGTHLIGSERVLKIPVFSSNTMDTEEAKPVGILLEGMRHVRVLGSEGKDKTRIIYVGRLIQIFHDRAENIEWFGLTFDIQRPPLSEFRVLQAEGGKAVIQVAEGSDYAVENGKFLWKGDWGVGSPSWMSLDLTQGVLQRIKAPSGWKGEVQQEAAAVDLGQRKVQLEFASGELGLRAGFQYIFFSNRRDRIGVFNDRCKDITFHDCQFHALSGMGFLSQFTENITYERVDVTPAPGTLRTCAALVDIFHFSNCRGEVRVESCKLSGMQDDAMNVHGTHLAITEKPAENQLLITYKHKQTYGFQPYLAGDKIAVINHDNLLEYPNNPRRKVVGVEKRTSRDWLITLDGAAPKFQPGDVVDNVTWHPNVTARNNHISVDAVRGFLLTSRGKMVIEGNTFQHCFMPGILLEGDASNWFESSSVGNLLITRNRFIGCGISINPHTKSQDSKEPVHRNIRIIDNYFKNAAISAKSTQGLIITGNRSPEGKISINIAKSCSELVQHDNEQIEAP